MSYTTRERYHAHVIKIKGHFLGSLEQANWRRTINTLIADGNTNIVVDLSGTDLMDSSGIGLLIDAAARVREADGDVLLAGLHTRIRNLFVMTRLLGPVFTSYETVGEAVQTFVDSSAVSESDEVPFTFVPLHPFNPYHPL